MIVRPPVTTLATNVFVPSAFARTATDGKRHADTDEQPHEHG